MGRIALPTLDSLLEEFDAPFLLWEQRAERWGRNVNPADATRMQKFMSFAIAHYWRYGTPSAGSYRYPGGAKRLPRACVLS